MKNRCLVLVPFLLFCFFGRTSAQVIDAGASHSVILCTNGHVWACGSNYYGQLGDSLSTGKIIPGEVQGLADIVSVSAGSASNYAVDKDGRVWVWGSNTSGQLGLGDAISGLRTPQVIPTMQNVRSVSAGWFYALFLLNDGTVWGCGQNDAGQLGNDSLPYSSVPVRVSGLENVIGLSAGYYHNLVLKSDSTVWAFGYNYWGQLGDGTTNNSVHPVRVLNISRARSVAAGWNHSLAVQSDGTLYAWGSNYFGEMGTGQAMNSDTHPLPTLVSSLDNVMEVKAEEEFSQALRGDGTLWMFGRNDNGQLGNNSTANSNVPVNVSLPGGVTGCCAGANFSLAMENDGATWSWGGNAAGQLGDSTYTEAHTPVRMILGCAPLSVNPAPGIIRTEKISVTPNPCTTFTLVRIEPAISGACFLRLYDCLGNPVMTIPGTRDGKFGLQRGGLDSGAYLFTISSNDRYIGSGKIIME